MPTKTQLVSDLREMLADDDASKNLLNGKKRQYSDKKLEFYLKQALRDLNSGSPQTDYKYEDVPDKYADLLISGAMIYCFISEGVLQLRNQIDYSDGGLALNLFNKTGAYQGWAQFMLQSYISGKTEFKRGILPNSYNAGFYGVASPFHPSYGRNGSLY